MASDILDNIIHEMSDWQTMDTCPEDIEAILFLDEGYMIIAQRWRGHDWTDTATGQPLALTPILWLPLPKRPSSDQYQAGEETQGGE